MRQDAWSKRYKRVSCGVECIGAGREVHLRTEYWVVESLFCRRKSRVLLTGLDGLAAVVASMAVLKVAMERADGTSC